MIDKSITDEILSRADIIDIVGEVVDLKRRGANYIGLCPFHNEKTPSFTVSPDKGIYKCFGCGKSGNAFSFLRDYHSLSFTESVKMLADRYGIAIEELTPKKKKELSKQELIYKALEYAGEFYSKILESEIGKPAQAYYHKRNFSPEIIKNFALGYSPDEWDSLLNKLKSLNFTEEVLLNAGLIIHNEDRNSYYDRFRGRAIFPIHNPSGKIIGFGARDMSGADNVPKYINSPQTPVYDKSSSLYGIYQAKSEIRNKKHIILAEGYADVISLHQGGFKTAIASSGTSLTEKQLQILSKYASKLYISYDSDNAGQKATDRAIDLAIPRGFEVNVVMLPKGDDPDSIIREHGADLYKAYLGDAISFIDFKIEYYKTQNLLDSPKDKSDFIRALVKLISRIPDRLEHDFHIAKLADRMSLSESQLRDIYSQKNISEREEPKHEYLVPVVEDYLPDYESIEQAAEEEKPIELTAEEKMLFTMIVKDERVLNYCVKKLKLNADYFPSESARELFSAVEKLSEIDKNITNAINSESNELSKRLTEYLVGLNFEKDSLSENWPRFGADEKGPDIKRIISDSMIKIELKKIEIEVNDIKIIQKEEPGIQVEYLMRLTELNQRRIQLMETLNFVNV